MGEFNLLRLIINQDYVGLLSTFFKFISTTSGLSTLYVLLRKVQNGEGGLSKKTERYLCGQTCIYGQAVDLTLHVESSRIPPGKMTERYFLKC